MSMCFLYYTVMLRCAKQNHAKCPLRPKSGETMLNIKRAFFVSPMVIMGLNRRNKDG